MRHGPCTGYYPNGSIREKGQYLNDRLEGEFLRYHMDGKPHEIQHFKQGKPLGPPQPCNGEGAPGNSPKDTQEEKGFLEKILDFVFGK